MPVCFEDTAKRPSRSDHHQLILAGDNNLSFIETSALDASNVELAFQNILTGMTPSIETRRLILMYKRLTSLTQRSTGLFPARLLIMEARVHRIPSVKGRYWRSASQPIQKRRRATAARVAASSISSPFPTSLFVRL